MNEEGGESMNKKESSPLAPSRSISEMRGVE